MNNKLFESEDYVTRRMNVISKSETHWFQFMINDEDDDSYLPNFDFEYLLVDCKNDFYFHSGKLWKDFIDSPIPVAFINTAYLFKQFENDTNGVSGAAQWAAMFYLYKRDYFWQSKAKLIFSVTNEAVDAIWNYVNFGFTVECIPIYFTKNKI